VNLDYILEKSTETGDLSRDEILYLLSLESADDLQKLYTVGDRVRKANCGDEVHIRGLIEFSNVCARKCNYCGLRAPNGKIKRYRMSVDEIVEVARQIKSKGIYTVVLQSGEDPYYTGEMISHIVQRVKAEANLAVTLSVGERSYEDYRMWKKAGADRYLLRHETANRELYAALHPDGDFDRRMLCLQWLKELGYQVGAGCMVGVPGQNIEHMADDVEFLKTFQPDMVGIGPYISHPDTPYAGTTNGTLHATLKMVALARIVTRDSLIPATTAIGSIEELGREMALQVGADVVMPNYTPPKYREYYEIYPNKRCITEDPDKCNSCLRMRIASVGRTVSTHYGHSRKHPSSSAV